MAYETTQIYYSKIQYVGSLKSVSLKAAAENQGAGRSVFLLRI